MEKLSAKNIAIVKLAIIICNAEGLKREILCAVGSECYNETVESHCVIEMWNRIVERKSETILRSLKLPKDLQDKVMGAILTIGRKMLNWAKYQEQILGLSCEQSVKFLNIHFFTQQGTIDTTKVSEELRDDINLSVKQKYVVACLHYHTDLITSLYGEMNNDDKMELCSSFRYPGFVKYWTYCLMGREKDVEYALQLAVKSGSVKAVKGVLELTDSQGDRILSIAKQALRYATKSERRWAGHIPIDFSPSKPFWTPIDYYLDVIHFLLSKMYPDKIAEFISVNVIHEVNGVQWKYSNLLKYFLNWPYQEYFKIVCLMWKSLPKDVYCDLLRTICKKIEPLKGDPTYGEEKNYDYRGLLREFWCKSPEEFKRYVFSLSSTEYTASLGFESAFSVHLLFELFLLRDFTYEDEKLVRLIIANATEEEREDIFTSENSIFWMDVISMEEWKAFNRILHYCFPNEEEAAEFKREYIYTFDFKDMCVRFLMIENYNSLQTITELISFPKEEIRDLKKTLVFSDTAKKVFVHLAFKGEWNKIEAIFNWCCLSEEEIRDLKKALVFSDTAKEVFVHLAFNCEWNKIEAIFNWCCLSEKEIKKVKLEAICSDTGKHICRDICFSKGGEEAERFCQKFLSSEKEMKKFQKEFVSGHLYEIDCISMLVTHGADFFSDFLHFCILPKKKLTMLKNRIFNDNDIKDRCRRFCLEEGVENAKKFCETLFTTEEEARDFRKKLIFTEKFSRKHCADLLKEYNVQVVSDLLNFCFIPDEKLKELKEFVASDEGALIFQMFINHTLQRPKTDNNTFSEFDWGDVEQLLTWCFSSEEDMRNFKKHVLLPRSGALIHSDFIKYNQWAEAENFFAWLELSGEEIKQLKRVTLEECFLPLQDHVQRDECAASVYGGWEGVMQLFLRWFITDKEEDVDSIVRLKVLFQPEPEFESIEFKIMLEEHQRDLIQQVHVYERIGEH